MAAWPGTLPAQPRAGTLRPVAVPNTVNFFPDVGREISRRRQTATGTDMTASMLLTPAQKTILDNFFADDTKDGSLSFTMTDWELDTTQTFRFRAPPQFAEHPDGDYYTVALTLRRLA